jgi:hypothetical protein
MKHVQNKGFFFLSCNWNLMCLFWCYSIIREDKLNQKGLEYSEEEEEALLFKRRTISFNVFGRLYIFTKFINL